MTMTIVIIINYFSLNYFMKITYMLKFINIPVFLATFAIGIFAVYVTAPDKKKIIVYPSPDNYQNIQYVDRAGTCFQFKQTRVTCPKDGKEMFKTPIQAV